MVSKADIRRNSTEQEVALPPGLPDLSNLANIRLKVGIYKIFLRAKYFYLRLDDGDTPGDRLSRLVEAS